MEEIRAVIALLKRPEFKPAEIEDDLHNRIARAVHDKTIKTFDMRVGSLDGDEDLTFMREVEEVVRKSWATLALKDISTASSRRSMTTKTGNGCGVGRPVQALPSR